MAAATLLSLLSLPVDVWLSVPLDRRDFGSLALTCRDMRAAVATVLCARGLRASQTDAPALADPRWSTLLSLRLRGMPRRYGVQDSRLPELVAPRFQWLASLTLHHCRLPADRPFWPEVFVACPRLKRVTVVGDFFMGNYAVDVNHAADLVAHGAPRLERLDMEGNWMIIHPRFWTPAEPADILQATTRVYSHPAVESTTLRHYRAACKQVPLGVNAPLVSLHIDEPSEPPFVVSRMGPRTLEHVERMVWRHGWPKFDAGLLGAFRRLRDLEVHIESATSPARMTRCLDSLCGLPTSLRRLSVHLDIWAMRTYEDDIRWGEPLRHLHLLESLEVEMLFPPSTVGDLLAGWLGAGEAVRRVQAAFKEPVCRGYEHAIQQLVEEEDVDPEDDSVVELQDAWREAARPVANDGLLAWLHRHPGARVVVRGLKDRLECAHPRAAIASGY